MPLTVLKRLLAAALVAGLFSGVVVAALTAVTTTPVIIAAEAYESPDEAAHDHGAAAHDHADAADAAAPHSHDGEGWAPADGAERLIVTSVATVGASFGFALIVLSLMVVAGVRIDARSGLGWGVAAFVAAGLAPALGLSPELPGAAAADLAARQAWWIGCVVATGAGLYLALGIARPVTIAAGLVLIALPHLVGAPQPDAFASTAPSELAAEFAAGALVVQAVAWALAGLFAAIMWQRLGREAAPA